MITDLSSQTLSSLPQNQPHSESGICRLNSASTHAVPRYTSYPTADRFVEAFTHTDFERYLESSRLAGVQSLSLYIHIPYCRSLCYYCACNKQVANRYKPAPFLDALRREMKMVSSRLGAARFVHMHWGGGTPTYLNANDTLALFNLAQQYFNFADNAEYAIEIDPRTVDQQKIQLLASLGFTRASLGIQDFDLQVQQKINRVQPVAMVDEVISDLRSSGFQSVNFDLITGLPKQTVNSFSATLDAVIRFKPDRLSMYNYAHLPARFKAQRLLDRQDLPNPSERQAIFEMSTEKLLAARYRYIGMDHFALPDDDLSIAQQQGTLHRNFQGYTTQGENDLIGLGPSAISKIGASYSQNIRSLREYIDTIDEGVLPTGRGIELSRDDLLRRSVISAIMCQNLVDKRSIEAAYLIDFDTYFSRELQQLEPMAELGWVEFTQDSLRVTNQGRRNALRNVANVFDKYSQEARLRSRNARVQ